MAATLVTHPLDTLRLRMAVDPAATSLASAAAAVLGGGGGARALYRGLGASLAGIAPYMAIELAAFDVLGAAEAARKSAAAATAEAAAAEAKGKGGSSPPPPPPRWTPTSLLVNGFGRGATAALIATACCYPLDTARRRVQLAGAGVAGGEGLATLMRRVAAEEGPGALYRGFWPNAAKNLPNKGVKLGTFDAAKKLLGRAQAALEEERAAAAARAGGGRGGMRAALG
jgi:solute carrier family 25 phosphate transporter 23/24/25/41